MFLCDYLKSKSRIFELQLWLLWTRVQHFRGKYIYWKEETIPGQPFENQKLFPRKLRPSQGDIHKWSNFWGVFEPLPKPSPLKMIWNSQSIEPSCKVWKKSHLNTFFQACGKRFAPTKIRNFSQNLRFCLTIPGPLPANDVDIFTPDS